MNKTISEARAFVLASLPYLGDVKDTDIVIAPPFTALSAMSELLKGSPVRLSAQDVFYEENGAFTGAISPDMLKDAGCEYVIIGHSERRQYFHETDETVNKKIIAAVKKGLGVIFCIGESLSEREAEKTFEKLDTQIARGLKGVDAQGLVVAYEPIWAIGTGRTATPELAQDTHSHIRGRLADIGAKAEAMRIIYGGSITPENIDSLMACKDIDGALVGGASLKPDSFERIVKFKRGI